MRNKVIPYNFLTSIAILSLVLIMPLLGNSTTICSHIFSSEKENLILSDSVYDHYTKIFYEARERNSRIPPFKMWTFEPNDPIRPGEYAAIYYYTVHPSFVEMNTNLRRNIPEGDMRPYIRAAIKLAISGLSKLPDFKGPVYRGGLRNGEFYNEVLEKYKVGTIITEPTFLSTSEGSRLRSYFKSPPLADFYIISKTGKNIQDIAINPKEREVLFLPGTRFHVDKAIESPRLQIWMTEI